MTAALLHPPSPATSTKPRQAFLLGTNFSGSTVFGQALGAHPEVAYLGEVDRAVRFPQTIFAHDPDPTCHYCELHDQACPVWTPERVGAARDVPYGRLLPWFREQLGAQAVVDGSKHPAWLRAIVADQAVDPQGIVTFLTVRSPFAFADSYRFRTGCAPWEAANVWRDVYYDALRMVSRASWPSMVVRYEHFALDPEPVLRSAAGLLGVGYEPVMRHFQGQDRHDVGGNFNVFAAPRDGDGDFSVDDFGKKVPATWPKEQSQGYWGRPFGGWVDQKWHRNLSADDVEQVLQTPGLGDLANLLGYELGQEIAGWARAQSPVA